MALAVTELQGNAPIVLPTYPLHKPGYESFYAEELEGFDEEEPMVVHQASFLFVVVQFIGIVLSISAAAGGAYLSCALLDMRQET